MKYLDGSDFLYENLILRRCPKTARQAYNKLVCLRELERRHGRENMFILRPLSKRHERLLRMYWAFRRMGR